MRVIKVSSILRAGSNFLDTMEQLFSKSSLRSYFAEFISTFIFVYAGVGSAMSAGKLMGSDGASAETRLLVMATAHAFALFAAVFVSEHVSGGHVNPAVTLGLVIGGHLRILTGIFYFLAQLLGSVVACLLLVLLTAGHAIPTVGLAPHMTGMGGMIMECIATFGIVCTVYAAKDPRNGSRGITGPVAIGFIYGANIIITGPFSGGFMNPARSIGPATVTGDFRSHWVYWVGPLLGGLLAGLVYPNFMAHTVANQQPAQASSV